MNMNKKKIGFCLSNFGIGGAERQYGYLMDHIDRSRYEVFFIQISHKKSRPKNLSHEGMTVATFEMSHKLDIGVAFRIARYVRENKIDLIQSLLFLDNQIARLVGFLTGKPVITSLRGGPHEGKFKTWIDHGFQFLSRCVTVNSHWLKGLLVDKGVDPEKIVVIHNGIDPAKFQSKSEPLAIREKLNIGGKIPTMTIVARLHPMKQHQVFFDVVKLVRERIPNVLALVAGEGGLRDELENYVKEIGIVDNVRFLGAVRGQDLADLLRVSDVQLLTSGWGESLPNVLLEAMSASVPIVSTNIHGIPEVVDEGVNGFMVSTGDRIGMAERVVNVLQDDELKRRFVESGLRKVEAFGMDAMVKKFEDLYARVLAS